MYKRILVPVDGSPTANQALVAALQLARESGGRVRIVHAFDELAFLWGYEYEGNLARTARDDASKLMRESLEMAEAAGVPADTHLLDTHGKRLGDAVAEEAREWDADLIAIGTHGRRGLSRALLGSGAEYILRISPVPVLVVRGGDAGAP